MASHLEEKMMLKCKSEIEQRIKNLQDQWEKVLTSGEDEFEEQLSLYEAIAKSFKSERPINYARKFYRMYGL